MTAPRLALLKSYSSRMVLRRFATGCFASGKNILAAGPRDHRFSNFAGTLKPTRFISLNSSMT